MPKVIVIDSFIGPFGYSQQYVRNMLDEAKNEAVEVQISSLGGALNHALAIHDMFAEHGNVSAKLNGFVASAGTLIGLPCKTVISENSFYLIHKVLSWIDEFGMMNEDDLEELIEKLAHKKDENAKMTLVIAQRYFDKSAATGKNKSLQDILALMKKDTWLSAQEAVEWGFVDKTYKPAPQSNHIDELKMVAMASAAGLPPIPRNHLQNQNTMNTNIVLPKLNTVLNIDELVVQDEGSFLSVEQLTAVDAALEQIETNELELQNRQAVIDNKQAEIDSKQAEIDRLVNEIATKNNEVSTAKQQLTDVENSLTESRQMSTQSQSEIDTRQAEIDRLTTELVSKTDEVNTLNEKLQKLPAARAILLTSTDPNLDKKTGDVDWAAIDNLPHNREL